MKLKTHTYVTPRNNEKTRVWKKASPNFILQRILSFRLSDTMGSLKSRISPNIINQIGSIKGYRPEGRFSSTHGYCREKLSKFGTNHIKKYHG